jgi:glycosyltransferase involved in cell wall biosynthesis
MNLGPPQEMHGITVDEGDRYKVTSHSLVHERKRSRPFKIVHAAETSGGGIATYLGHLLTMQREHFGAGNIAAVLPISQSHFIQAPAGVEIITFDDRAGRMSNSLRLARRLRAYISSESPDVVHLHSTFAGAVLRPMLLSLRTNARIIYCPHGWAFDRRTSGYVQYGAKWVERRLAPLCDAIVCISHHEVRAARSSGIAANKLALVRNGVPVSAPAPSITPSSVEWPPGKLRILFVGRFDRQKGVDVLLRAMAELTESAFASIIGGAVVGDSSIDSVPQNVRVYGWLSPGHLEAFYESADVVVIPSRWEGFGLVAVEAMRAGLPVIASNVGGLSEIVDDGVTGVLIPPDDPSALVQALQSLDDSQLRGMGKAGRERFLRQFTMERTHRQLCDLYSASRDVGAAESVSP